MSYSKKIIKGDLHREPPLYFVYQIAIAIINIHIDNTSA